MSKQQRPKKQRKTRWTDVPNPKCSMCKVYKLHTKAQHDLSVKRWNESHSIFDGWVIKIN